MHSFGLLTSVAFAAAVNAVEFTNSNYNIVALQPFTITWSGNTGPVTIFLKNGDPSNLQTLNTVVSGATGNSFLWIPSASLSNDVYTLEIEDDGENDPNYSPQFQYSGGVAVPSSTTSVASSSSATASTTSTASSTSDSSSSSITASTTDSSSASSASSSATATTSASSNSTVTTTRSSNTTSATSTSTERSSSTTKSSATSSRTSESATPSSTGDSKNAAGRLANPIALILFACGVFAFFN